jgi:hypothetical protein
VTLRFVNYLILIQGLCIIEWITVLAYPRSNGRSSQLVPGVSLQQATVAIEKLQQRLGLPRTVRGALLAPPRTLRSRSSIKSF